MPSGAAMSPRSEAGSTTPSMHMARPLAIAPDRALPLVGIAQVLIRLGKPTEALTTFDRALDRAPADEVALRGRADALATLGDRAHAAETLDRLAATLVAAGRRGEALDLLLEALDLAEGP